mgnify:CR=1 FL=1
MTIVSDAMIEVANAAAAYERRWTVAALKALDPELHARFVGQQDDWHAALVTGSDADVREQTAAMCRGWAAITKRMEGQPDDAYMLGICPRTGLRVAITTQKAVCGRLQELGGEPVLLVHPDEVAVMLAAQQAIASIKSVYPGAEVIELRPAECATAG